MQQILKSSLVCKNKFEFTLKKNHAALERIFAIDIK